MRGKRSMWIHSLISESTTWNLGLLLLFRKTGIIFHWGITNDRIQSMEHERQKMKRQIVAALSHSFQRSRSSAACNIKKLPLFIYWQHAAVRSERMILAYGAHSTHPWSIWIHIPVLFLEVTRFSIMQQCMYFSPSQKSEFWGLFPALHIGFKNKWFTRIVWINFETFCVKLICSNSGFH